MVSMKLGINKNFKIVSITVIILLFIVTSIYMYCEYKVPHYEEEIISLYKYNNKTSTSYNVLLKPNILYEEESLGEGHIYITEFIDHIKASYHYEFNGERNADIKGDYEIIAQVEGYTGEEKTYKTIWKKGFTLVPKKDIHKKDKTISINEDISIKLSKFNDFAKQVLKDAKIDSSVKLMVVMNVNLTAKTDKGVIEEKMSPALVIPLDTSYFSISGNLSEEKPGTIEETKQVQLPVNKNKVILYGIILGILFILLIFLLFFTKAKPMIDPFEKKIKKIFKKHGDRLVALNNEIAVICESYSEVNSIEDLVRIADEIEKPIMYKHSLDCKEISKFYVNDDTQMYVFDLSKIVIDKNLKNRKKDKSQDDVNKLKKTISQIKASKPKKKETGTETTESES